MLDYDIAPLRGLVRISGVVPNGPVVVQRRSEGLLWFTLRGGAYTVTNQGFNLEDSEPPIGVPLTYRATSTPVNRLVQRNLVMTPDFTHGAQSWTAGASRTLTVSAGKGEVTSNPAGGSAGIPGRTIAEVGVAQLLPSTRYLVTGTVKFTTPDVWTWLDVRNFGTWAAVKAAKSTWADVRSSAAGTPPPDAFNTLSVSLSAGTTNYVVPLQVMNVPISKVNQWFTFSAYFTTPATIPATARLRLLHGSSVREFSTAWSLDQFGIMTAADASEPYSLAWMSGDTPVPDRPQDYLMQNTEWEAITNDAVITWEGAIGNSASKFLAPSQIATSVVFTIETPTQDVPCEPVLLSDPVSSSLAQWFGLGEIDTISRAARASVFSVLGRADYIGSASVRSAATGKFTLYTDTLAERSQALLLFSSGRVLLFRNPDPAYPESLWYIMVGDVDEERTLPDARRPERTWTVPFVQVERPVGLIEASTGVTWQQVRDSGMTWRDLRDRRVNWLGVLVDAP